jgi:hypothetical protein
MVTDRKKVKHEQIRFNAELRRRRNLFNEYVLLLFTYLTNRIFCGVRNVLERIIAIMNNVLRRIVIKEEKYSTSARINREGGCITMMFI